MSRAVTAILVLAVAVAAGSMIMEKGLPGCAGPAPEPGGAAHTPDPAAVAGLQLVVLNGTHVPGLARDMGMLLARAHLAPVRYGNAAPQDYATSFLVNRRLTDTQAAAVSRLLGGIPVLREFDGRGAEDAVLVLGADHEQLRGFLAAHAI